MYISTDEINRRLQRFEAFWEFENHDRPIISITTRKNDVTPREIEKPSSLEAQWKDYTYVLEKTLANFECTNFHGESIPQIWPNLGPDIFGSFFGAKINYMDTTSYSEHFVEDFSKDTFEFQKNENYKYLIDATNYFLDNANGRYLVGTTDIHPGMDGLVSIRGPENLCYDLIDDAEPVKTASFKLFDAFKTVFDETNNLIMKRQPVTTNWMGISSKKRFYVTSCDFCCMISQDMFEEFVIPELIEEMRFLDRNIFHLDGPQALKHLDRLLQIEELNGVQWVYGAGQKTAAHWISTLKKIQKANKLIQVNIVKDDVDALIENLKPEGVHYVAHANSPEEAEWIIKRFEEGYRKKIY